MSAIDDRPFPRGALIGAGLLVLITTIGAAGARWQAVNAPVLTPAAAARAAEKPVLVREVRFLDEADGSVSVRDVRPDVAPMTVAAGGNGFIRGVMRGFARDRRARGIDSGPAFRLSEWPDGRLTLEDTATGRIVDLDGFGPTNRAAFARLLRPDARAATAPASEGPA